MAAFDKRPARAQFDRRQRLFVSNRFRDHPPANYEAQIKLRHYQHAMWAKKCRGVMKCRRVRYKSAVDNLVVPALLFHPLRVGLKRRHAAMVWVHGGVHGSWDLLMYPFVREAIHRGYVIIAPDYRGSSGYGEDHYLAADYGGREVDDVISAQSFLSSLPFVDTHRIGVMGWSHGGCLSILAACRKKTPFVAAAAHGPVSDLILRLSYKGPIYQSYFATQRRICGLPFEKLAAYLKRSPVYQVENLAIPLLVHVATNDADVPFHESQHLIWKLLALKNQLADTLVYHDPPVGSDDSGHTFNLRVDISTYERADSAEQIDSWNRVWTFFEPKLQP